VVEMLVTVTSRAIERVNRYAPTRLARPLAFLHRAGFTDADIDDAAIADLAAMCRRTSTQVEVSERHQTPSKRLAGLLAAAGVRLVAASDARQAGEVGRWRHVQQVSGDLAPVGG
jgi:putative hydrolase